MLYKNRCNPMHHLNGALPGSCVLVRVTRRGPGRTSVYLCAALLQNLAYRMTFIHLSVSLWSNLADPVFDGVGLAGFKSRANAFLLS